MTSITFDKSLRFCSEINNFAPPRCQLCLPYSVMHQSMRFLALHFKRFSFCDQINIFHTHPKAFNVALGLPAFPTGRHFKRHLLAARQMQQAGLVAVFQHVDLPLCIGRQIANTPSHIPTLNFTR